MTNKEKESQVKHNTNSSMRKKKSTEKKKMRTTKATGKQRTKLQLVHNGQQLLEI